MKPEANSRRLFGITRAKGKMYEFDLPEESHIAIPEGSFPDQLLMLTIGTLGDISARYSDLAPSLEGEDDDSDLQFAASFFDALLASKLVPELREELVWLASAAYFLEGRPGSSLVMARFLNEREDESSLESFMRWILEADWSKYSDSHTGVFGDLLNRLSERVAYHFFDGSGVDEIAKTTDQLRYLSYDIGDAQELFLADLICAVIKRRVFSSTWINLPQFSGLPADVWASAIRKKNFPKELWPSQQLIGESGFFAGSSGIVQMPTSAGKTRSVEMILRSAFLSGRTSTAVVVAPFRSLCHEINQSLVYAFSGEKVKVDQLSDALQPDYLDEFEELFGISLERSPSVVVMTPEKFLYVLRQNPTIVENLGLVVYDEGHQFDSGYRGITYELLLTEIKHLLSETAQTVLISAVVQNARGIAEWLVGGNARVVQGFGLLPTARSTAFASWVERRGQVMFYEGAVADRSDYFVPRVIEQQELDLLGQERKKRFFPERDDAVDVSLYLGLRLASEGAIAIFCGRKSTAEKIVKRVVDIYKRNLDLPQPSAYSNAEEIRKLMNLYTLHFGEDSESAKAAEVGVFSHHGNTPHGVRLAVEFAMKQGLIKFVACTSTLAQGVNLPVRYLIVSGVHQGPDRIKVRDFHNLIGRAGRAGMHTEGLVIFGDPRIYDRRLAERWRFDSAKELLDPNQAEPTSSSLLSLIDPLQNQRGDIIPLEHADFLSLLIKDEHEIPLQAGQLVERYPRLNLDAKALAQELKTRRKLVTAIESYLMVHRGDSSFEQYLQEIVQLAAQTLAYSLADDNQKMALKALFAAVAQYVEDLVPNSARQLVYGKTLLGANQAQNIEEWTQHNRDYLLSVTTNDGFIDAIWEILVEQLDSKFAKTVLPEELPKDIAKKWISGASYQNLFEFVRNEGGTKPWGERRRQLTEEDIVGFCESTLGFEFPLGVAAITEFLFAGNALLEDGSKPILGFHKSLKYGVPEELAVSCYEFGFADRMLARNIAERLRAHGYQGAYFLGALDQHVGMVQEYLSGFPSYFSSVMSAKKNKSYRDRDAHH